MHCPNTPSCLSPSRRYFIFLIIYTYATLMPTSSEDLFYFQNDLKGQFTGVEFLPEHSPTWGKTFNDVATVGEYTHWLLGPFLQAAYGSGTFDGDDEYQKEQNMTRYILGYVKESCLSHV